MGKQWRAITTNKNVDTFVCVCIELVASRIIYSNLSQYLIFRGLHSYYGTVLLDENKSSVTSAVHDT